MRTFLLAAGLGTRLRPLTYNIPKCLVSIKGLPLLGIWLKRLTEANIGPFLINTHYLPEQVEAFIKASPYYEQVTLINEIELKGTAGSLIANLDFFQGEEGLIIHADNYCLADFTAFQRAHINRPAECLMTMMTFRTNNPSSCGIVKLDERGIVSDFYEKVDQPPGNLANGAIYILTPELLKKLGTDYHESKNFSTEIISRFIGQIYSYETLEIFIDIGNEDNYNKANR